MHLVPQSVPAIVLMRPDASKAKHSEAGAVGVDPTIKANNEVKSNAESFILRLIWCPTAWGFRERASEARNGILTRIENGFDVKGLEIIKGRAGNGVATHKSMTIQDYPVPCISISYPA